MSGQQLTDYLKSLPADAVSKIEFITNPSSKYDAAGSAGIINIKLKKNQAYGLNGTANIGVGVGRYGKANGGVNLNYRKDKLNLFGSSYTGYSMSYSELTLNSVLNNNGAISFQDRNNYWHPTSIYSSYKGGADYNIGKNSTIGVLYRGSLSHTDARTDNTTTFKNVARQPTSFVQGIKNDTDRVYNHFFNVNYKATLDTLGSELNIDVDYSVYKNSSADINENYFYDGQMKTTRPAYLFRNTQPATGTIKAVKADYTRFFANKMKLETGFKISQVNSDNDLMVDSLTTAKNWQKDKNRSNHFVYDEAIYAAYANVSKTVGKTSIQAGLRAEQTNSTGNSITINKVDK
ncbi:MAG: TonB-dependent receptor, partial [Hymenobacter sp.]